LHNFLISGECKHQLSRSEGHAYTLFHAAPNVQQVMAQTGALKMTDMKMQDMFQVAEWAYMD